MAHSTEAQGERSRTAAALVALALLALLAWYARTQLDLRGRPEEDAAMLLRYSRHLAQGHGIVWNLGEPPVDGATDFLFMLLAAAVHRAGFTLETAARGIGLAAHALTVLLLFFGARRLHGVPAHWAAVPAVFFALGPALRPLAACYGTPLFTLAVAVGWVWATLLARAPAGGEGRPALGLALSALGMGLARPEGVFLGGFMLLAVVLVRGGTGLGTILGRYLLVFLTLGLAYFLWRWWYFGWPLPNPFYKKGAFLLHWHSLRMAWRDLWRLGLPFLLLPLLGLFVRQARRAALFVLLPVGLFVALWVLISDETNYLMRFRQPIVPVLLLGSLPVAQALGRRLRETRPWLPRLPRSLSWAAALALAAALGWAEHREYRYLAPQRMGLYDAAQVLHDYARRGYTLATTEAGLLPLYSEWRAIDAWGLNDAYVAHHGGIDQAYLERRRPEVLMVHAYFSPGEPRSGPRVENRALGPAWYRMVVTLVGYAEANDYRLAACFGRNARDTHYYYVRRGFPLGDEIAARLRALDYYWDGEPTTDYAQPAAAGRSGLSGRPRSCRRPRSGCTSRRCRWCRPRAAAGCRGGSHSRSPARCRGGR